MSSFLQIHKIEYTKWIISDIYQISNKSFHNLRREKNINDFHLFDVFSCRKIIDSNE